MPRKKLFGRKTASAEEIKLEWNGHLTQDMIQSYDENGFFIAKCFLDKEEVAQLTHVMNARDGILRHSFTSQEPNGKCVVKSIWAHPGNDVSGMVARSEKVVNTCEKLLNSEVYHWCSMYVLKEEKIGGKHEWHQDYGYWYNDGCLYPDMVTVWIPLDKCTQENGCKQAFIGSHKLGRINHVTLENGQKAAEEKRIAEVRKRFRHVYLEMEPGDAFVHHCNLLHSSGENGTDKGRLAFMSCYNCATNTPFGTTDFPSYSPIEKIPDSKIKECMNFTDFTGKNFMSHE